MLAIRPDLSKVRNDVFKRIIGGVQSSKPIDLLANQIVEELSNSMMLIDNPSERSAYIREIYNRLEGVQKVRRYHYVYESLERNKNVARVVNEVLFRFRSKFSRYF